MTNPNSAIGTNAALNGRTSVNAFNDILSALNRGVVSGWNCKPSSGMSVTLGGSGTERDVAIAEDNAGNKTTINNIVGLPVSVTLAAAPGANSRIDAIVAYVNGSVKGSGNIDNPDGCGIIPVSGTVASAPSMPDDSAIRTAITADGANGTSAYYVVLATIKVTTSLTTITDNNITQGDVARLHGQKMVTSDNVEFPTLKNYSTSEQDTGVTWIDGGHIYQKTINIGTLPNVGIKSIDIGATIKQLIKIEAMAFRSSDGTSFPLPFVAAQQVVTAPPDIQIEATRTQLSVHTLTDRSALTAYVTLYYIK